MAKSKDGLQIKYSENRTKVSVTTYLNRTPVTKVITEKSTGLTTIEVYKEGVRNPIERYVYNRIKEGD